MQSFTIDASVALKWVSGKDELLLEKAKNVFTQAVNKEITLITPTLLKAEVTNILLKKKKISVKDVQKALTIINRTNIIYVELTDKLIKKAIAQADKYDLSVYDGIYLACANLSKTALISADVKGHGKIKNVILLKDFRLGS